MAKKTSDIPQKSIENYSKLIDVFPGIEQKGATMPYTSVNGHMFSFLDKSGRLVLRLPEEAREELIKKHKASPTEAHGVILKEYVTIPEKLFNELSALKKYFEKSLQYTERMKPKNKK